jgi:hypothetical protein
MPRILVAGSLLLGLAACSRETVEPTGALEMPAYGGSTLHAAHARSALFGTRLTPDAEVMPAGVVNTSKAVGNATFHLSADGSTLTYRLIVANIENVVQAHIHAGAAGSNGGVVAWLYPSTSPVAGPAGGDRVSGVIAEGTLTDADLMGALAGMTVADLVELITSGGAYVNVHTNDGVDPPNTGPGDYPGGELRGQIDHRGH